MWQPSKICLSHITQHLQEVSFKCRKNITRIFIYLFSGGRLYHWITSQSASETGKLGNSVFLLFFRSLALENISGADCLHASRISFKESAVLAPEVCLPPLPQAVLALLCLTCKGKPGWLWHGGAIPCKGWAYFTYTQITHFGGGGEGEEIQTAQ